VKDRNCCGSQRTILTLAGYFGNRYETLAGMAKDLDLTDSIRFLGQVRDIPGLLTAVDLSVLSSKAEGSPNGVLECMAAGLPVVGTNVAGIREALGSGSEPFLAGPGDADQLAQRLLQFLGDSALRRDIGMRNRARVEECYGPRKMCEQMTDLISRHLAA
jgi:glycosyltransferase involved in cell wall biosynthesis